MTRVLLAFDKFKDALTAPEAGEAVAAVLRGQHPAWTLDLAPLADGGEGFAGILTRPVGGQELLQVVTGPRGKRHAAGFGLVRVGDIPAAARALLQLPAVTPPGAFVAVVELAAISGLSLLAVGERDPWQTTTLGTGEILQEMAARGAVAIVLGVGGSATNDLGLGALAALGLKFTNAAGNPVHPPVPERWPEIVAVSGGLPPKFPPVYIACDVTNPLLGQRGAAAVYGPQKGLPAADLPLIEKESERLANLLCAHCDRPESLKQVPGAGAAGGIAFGLMTAAGARLLPGFEFVSAWLDLDARIEAADIVITGEGRFDESSLEGKGPGGVAARALARGKIVHVFAGQVSAVSRPGLALHAITPAGLPLDQALRQTAANLAAAVRRVLAG